MSWLEQYEKALDEQDRAAGRMCALGLGEEYALLTVPVELNLLDTIGHEGWERLVDGDLSEVAESVKRRIRAWEGGYCEVRDALPETRLPEEVEYDEAQADAG
jgi:hypothetical protein